jgi:nucleotide sugar dehydrogenase
MKPMVGAADSDRDRTADLFEAIDDRSARIAVLGQGYVGLLLAMRASEAGFAVLGFEIDDARAGMLAEGRSYVEDVPDDVLRAALARGYRASSNPSSLADFDVAIITVPTPLTEGHQPDLSHIEAASLMVAAALRPGRLVVLESTTYPGTTDDLVAPLLEQVSGLVRGQDFLLGYSPERIDPGNPQFGLLNTPKVVSGVDDASLRAVEAFYGTFVEKLVPVGSPAEAELVKLIENTFRHVNVALMNELSVFAHDLGVDIWQAIEAAATKPFGFMPFRPGPGVGGHCLPVDPSYLSWRVRRRLGETFRFVELANDVNDHMPRYVVRRVQAALNRNRMAVNGASILVLGLAYKPSTSDARESPALVVIDLLRARGATVRAADPYVARARLDAAVERVELGAAEVRAADLVLVLTDHPDFDYEMVAREASLVFDTRNCMRGFGGDHVETL